MYLVNAVLNLLGIYLGDDGWLGGEYDLRFGLDVNYGF